MILIRSFPARALKVVSTLGVYYTNATGLGLIGGFTYSATMHKKNRYDGSSLNWKQRSKAAASFAVGIALSTPMTPIHFAIDVAEGNAMGRSFMFTPLLLLYLNHVIFESEIVTNQEFEADVFSVAKTVTATV
jgi:hypothetical protein